MLDMRTVALTAATLRVLDEYDDDQMTPLHLALLHGVSCRLNKWANGHA
jgi:hypothetical protein